MESFIRDSSVAEPLRPICFNVSQNGNRRARNGSGIVLIVYTLSDLSLLGNDDGLWQPAYPCFVKWTKTSLVTVICTGLTFILFEGCGDYQESFYPSLADADRAGAIARGWIPEDLLPQHSKSIHEVHEISPPIEWCFFEFPLADSEGFRKNLKRVDVLATFVKHVPSPGVSWWPSVLNGDLDREKIQKAGFELYSAEKPATSVTISVYLFAVDWAKGQAFFYSTSAPTSDARPAS